MRKIILLIVTILVSSFIMQAQRSAYTWYFGIKAGIDFKTTRSFTASSGAVVTDVPIPLTGPISTYEGCFTYSDRITGNVMMSSDGSTVYNKNGVAMPNGTGLLGNPSSTSSGIVVPCPGERNLFYIFTVSAVGAIRNGIRYSVVDMSLNGGLGDIISGWKNLQVSLTGTGYTNTDVAENISVVQHANGVDYWLVSRMRKSVIVWAITAAGVSATPSVYNTTYDVLLSPTPLGGGIGYLKFNTDGTRFVHVQHLAYNNDHSWFTSGEFNRSTGVVSNMKVRDIDTEYGPAYAMEFSSNNEYLYVATIESASGRNGLYVSKWDDVVNLSKIPIPTTKLRENVSCVQLGPDGRIYGIDKATRNLYVVLNPDDGGTQNEVLPNYLNAGTTGYFGLPVFAVSFYKTLPIISKMPVCVGVDNIYRVTINLVGVAKILSLNWDFGDGTVVTQTLPAGSASGTYQYAHRFNNSGTYTITVTPTIDDGSGAFTDPDKISMKEITSSDCQIMTNPMIRIDVNR